MPPAEPASKKDAADQGTDSVIIMPPLLHMRSRAKGRLSSRSRFGNQTFNRTNLKPMQTRRVAPVVKAVARKASQEKERAQKETEASPMPPQLPLSQRRRPNGALMD